jgi:hypothetical protein
MTTRVNGDHHDDVDDAALMTATTERVPSPSPSPPPSSSSSSSSPLSPTIREDEVVAVIVNAKNVRGKTGFELDHSDLLDHLLVWALMHGHAGRTIVVVDHRNEPGAHLLCRGGDHRQDGDLSVSFAESRIKADNVIASDVRWLHSSSSSSPPSPSPLWSSASRRRRVVAVVVTADRELGWRCRCAAASAARGRSRPAAAAADDDDAGGVGCNLHLPLKVTILRSHVKD